MITIGIMIAVFVILQYRRYLKFVSIPENVKHTEGIGERYDNYVEQSDYNLWMSLTALTFLGLASFAGVIMLGSTIIRYLP
jgi:hypothetical protein